MTISIMITTRNRVDDLCLTLAKIKSLLPSPEEVLVTADGCMDSTEEMLESEKRKGEIKNLKVIVNHDGKGSVASRDQMMRMAYGDLVLSLDDDSYPQQVECLKTLQELFENNSNLSIATFPQRSDEYPKTLTQKCFGEAHSVRSYPSSGACLRVSTYRSLPGYEPMFFHAYEEPDYALQCVSAGYDVVYYPEITVRHHYSAVGRNEIRTHHRHARNELWSTVIRCPFPQMLLMIAWRIYSQARFAAKRGVAWLIREPLWWWEALKGIPQVLNRRHPVTWAGYRKWLSLPG
jgi:GT2 family glycosyltransferase